MGQAGAGPPGRTVAIIAVIFVASFAVYPFLGIAFFPRTDAGQFTINMKVPTGTRIENTDQYTAKVEGLVRTSSSPRYADDRFEYWSGR